MTPLILIPARQLSAGHPGKNRECWPALVECLADLPSDWPRLVLTDDPWIVHACQHHPTTGTASCWNMPIEPSIRCLYRYMPADHTVADCARVVLQSATKTKTRPIEHDPLVILQPSSPTRNRAAYVRAALAMLETQPQMSAVVSVTPWSGEPPTKACYMAADGTLTIPASPEPRQRQPDAYRRDGTVYAVRTAYAKAGDLYGPRPVPLLVSAGDSATVD